jgi:Zn-dependent peptidase ImmA (M78 family)
MPIPKRISIKGKTYKIRLRKKLVHEDGQECDGLCDLETRTIYINKELNLKKQKEVLLHELFHAIVEEAHINPGVRFTEGIEEVLCDAFADFLTTSTKLKWKTK